MADTATRTLADFLLARLDEDEAPARAYMRGERDGDDMLPLGCWDVPRVLAECKAKRRIVELHKPGGGDSGCWSCDIDCDRLPNEQYPCGTLRALALPYADHPDYRDEWRP